ncbi:bifunctional lytic transglycosylase/C40 family peptidase [Streptomyces sp. NPDC046942]|uniref:C40 family peptidase n=1 Tax=Streptomyces sp. NPDC046942 TaxID=3155137 RepID=UPI0033DBA7A9
MVVLLLFAAVCCSVPVGNAISAYVALKTGAQDGGGIAQGGSAADIPPRMLTAYNNAVQQVGKYVPKCQGMRWPILAGIAKVESNHAIGHSITGNGDITPHILGPVLDGSGVGGNTTVYPQGNNRALGPFQFLPSTWASYGKDGNGDRVADPDNADDAALTAAVYLCGNGRDLTQRSQLEAAILQYNHSSEYLSNVLSWIDQYTAAAKAPDLKNVSGKVRTVIEAALSQRGVPYSWGGGDASGPAYGSCCSPSGKSGAGIKGFDCSGLTTYAYARVGINLPRTAAEQAGVGRRIPAGLGPIALRPGDLVFYAYAPGRDSTIFHVGIYLGSGQMVNAARPGTVVRLDAVGTMSGFAGGARLL